MSSVCSVHGSPMRGNESGGHLNEIRRCHCFQNQTLSSLNGIIYPAAPRAAGRKNCGRVCGQWRGNLLKASSIPSCRGLQTIHWTLDNGVHQSHQPATQPGQPSTCNLSPELVTNSNPRHICHKFPHHHSHSAAASEKNWDERQLLCVAYHVFGVLYTFTQRI